MLSLTRSLPLSERECARYSIAVMWEFSMWLTCCLFRAFSLVSWSLPYYVCGSQTSCMCVCVSAREPMCTFVNELEATVHLNWIYAMTECLYVCVTATTIRKLCSCVIIPQIPFGIFRCCAAKCKHQRTKERKKKLCGLCVRKANVWAHRGRFLRHWHERERVDLERMSVSSEQEPIGRERERESLIVLTLFHIFSRNVVWSITM